MVKSWILNFVTKPIFGSILRFNDASDIWKDLLARYHLTNLPRSYQLTQQIWSLQQGSSDLSTYYTKLKTPWDDLDGAYCVTTCQFCVCCKATATKIEHTKVIKFLAGLNDSYSNARSQIIMKKHVPDLSGVYNLLDQDFNQRSITPVQNASAFKLTSGESYTHSVNAAYTKPSRPVCSHCGYNGHTIDKCYKIHGYPPCFKHKKNPSDKPAPASNDKHLNTVKPVVAQLAINDSTSTNDNSTAMSFGVHEVQWLVNMLREFDAPQHGPAAFFCDSTVAIHIANNVVFHERTKHLEDDCHKMRDMVEIGLIKTLHVTTSNQLADIFTKPLQPGSFHSLMGKMRLLSITSPS